MKTVCKKSEWHGAHDADGACPYCEPPKAAEPSLRQQAKPVNFGWAKDGPLRVGRGAPTYGCPSKWEHGYGVPPAAYGDPVPDSFYRTKADEERQYKGKWEHGYSVGPDFYSYPKEPSGVFVSADNSMMMYAPSRGSRYESVYCKHSGETREVYVPAGYELKVTYTPGRPVECSTAPSALRGRSAAPLVIDDPGLYEEAAVASARAVIGDHFGKGVWRAYGYHEKLSEPVLSRLHTEDEPAPVDTKGFKPISLSYVHQENQEAVESKGLGKPFIVSQAVANFDYSSLEMRLAAETGVLGVRPSPSAASEIGAWLDEHPDVGEWKEHLGEVEVDLKSFSARENFERDARDRLPMGVALDLYSPKPTRADIDAMTRAALRGAHDPYAATAEVAMRIVELSDSFLSDDYFEED